MSVRAATSSDAGLQSCFTLRFLKAAVEDMNSLSGCAGATVLFNKTQQEIILEK